MRIATGGVCSKESGIEKSRILTATSRILLFETDRSDRLPSGALAKEGSGGSESGRRDIQPQPDERPGIREAFVNALLQRVEQRRERSCRLGRRALLQLQKRFAGSLDSHERDLCRTIDLAARFVALRQPLLADECADEFDVDAQVVPEQHFFG